MDRPWIGWFEITAIYRFWIETQCETAKEMRLNDWLHRIIDRSRSGIGTETILSSTVAHFASGTTLLKKDRCSSAPIQYQSNVILFSIFVFYSRTVAFDEHQPHQQTNTNTGRATRSFFVLYLSISSVGLWIFNLFYLELIVDELIDIGCDVSALNVHQHKRRNRITAAKKGD
jgi:hypothetical protein